VAVEIEVGPRPEGDSWAELTFMTECLLTVLRRHPGCAGLAPLAVLACRPGLDITERALDLLGDQGVGADRSADLAHFLLSTCITLVSTQPGGHVPGHREESEIRARKAALISLPPDRYPRLIAAAPYMVDCPDDQVYYRRGIDFLIGGIRHEAGAARTGGNGAARSKPRRKATTRP
jgi:hypothetical protein